MEKEEYSKNEKAEKILGRRGNGTPLFLPHELGYSCPICGSEDEVNLEWSEYNNMLWCRKCDLDIPSCLCSKYGSPMIGQEAMDDKLRVKENTRIFILSVESTILILLSKELEKCESDGEIKAISRLLDKLGLERIGDKR